MLLDLFKKHVAEKVSNIEEILATTGYNELLVASGQVKVQFQDDMFYPFKTNPYFKEWLPLNKRQNCFLQLARGLEKPRLYLACEEDIWHTAPQSLPAGWDEPFEIIEYKTLEELRGRLDLASGELAYIGENNEFGLPVERCNPQTILNHIDYRRRSKTSYEHACVREANRRAVPAHRAAHAAFLAGASELEICSAYLSASNSSENDMPYPVIAGLNEHAGVLHHFMLDKQAPAEHHSFLIDAGVDFNGYASDITRTYAFDENSEFAEMIRAMDQKQLELVAAGKPGKSNIDLHCLSHVKVAEVLAQFDIINVSAEAAVKTGITNTFYPHGLGHGLGVNVHDKGGQLASPDGAMIPPPEAYPRLRNTTPVVAGQIHTVEPGLYFIPALLDKLRDTANASSINWDRVSEFIPYGGIRIEDNIIVHNDGTLENLTRDAFAEC